MGGIILPAALIIAAGLLTLSSVSPHLFLLQLGWAVLGFGVLVLIQRLDWRTLVSYRWLISGLYAIASLLLAVAYFTAPIIRNTRSWLVLGPASFQPVELAKIALILIYAQYFSRRHLTVARSKNIFFSFVLFAIPAGLVMLQPDLGSASVLFGIWFGFLLVSGLPRRYVLLAFALFAVVGFVGWNFALKDYQRERIAGVFYPERNALTVNYSTIQAKIAIGSAGLFGKGYGQGSQTQLGFLTEPTNDFILAAFIEEWGIVPGFLLIAIFVLLIVRILAVGIRAPHNFEKFICLGAAMVFGIHFLINAGSTVGIFPVVGVPFPLFSQGGSNLLASMTLLGLVHAISTKA